MFSKIVQDFVINIDTKYENVDDRQKKVFKESWFENCSAEIFISAPRTFHKSQVKEWYCCL